MPLLTAGKESEEKPRSAAQAKADVSARTSFASSSPSPRRGPTACTTALNGRLPAPVTTAPPTGISPCSATMRVPSRSSAGPAARAIAAATPPP